MIDNQLCERDTSILTVRRFLEKINIHYKSIKAYPFLNDIQKSYRVKPYTQQIQYEDIIIIMICSTMMLNIMWKDYSHYK